MYPSTTCTDCERGRYFAETGAVSSGACKLCPAGRYGDQQGAKTEDKCLVCPSGFFSQVPGITSQTACPACPHGRITRGIVSSPVSANAACLKCSPGQYSDVTPSLERPVIECKDCPSGTYLTSEGNQKISNCTNCPTGKYGPDQGSTSLTFCQDCPMKTYLDEEGAIFSNQCKKCPAGRKGDKLGLARPKDCTNCSKGHLAKFPGQIVCTLATPGYFVPNVGMAIEIACPPGTHGVSDRISCRGCPAGFYQSLPAKTSCKPVGPGHFTNNSGNIAQIACPPGNHGENERTQCRKCPAGFFQTRQGRDSCSLVAPGHYTSAVGSVAQITCAPGTHSINDRKRCRECPSGFYQPSSSSDDCTIVAPGYYTNNSRSIVQIACVPGKHGTNKRISCKSCKAGFYQSLPAKTSCTLVEPGHYTSAVGSVARIPCAAGTHGTNLRKSCRECPSGFYQPSSASDNCQQVAPGYYTNYSGSVLQIACPPGKHGTNARFSCKSCEAGYYQAGEAKTSCKRASAGYYTATTGSLAPTSCPPGRHGALERRDLCEPCQAGKYSAAFGQTDKSACKDCRPGKYLNTTGGKSEDDCTNCVQGRYNTKSGAKSLLDCPLCGVGLYNDESAQISCKKCRVGRYNNMLGAASPDSCPACRAGQYGNELAMELCFDCVPGLISIAAGATQCDKCPSGRYQNKPGEIFCIDCPSGYYTDSTSDSSVGGECNRCEPGRYNDYEAASSCDFCPKGWYQSGYASLECQACALGRYVQCTGSYECLFCETGRTSEPKVGGLRCVAERVQTSQPIMVPNTHMYTGDQKITATRIENMSSMCVTWRMGNKEEREAENEVLPYQFEDGFLVQWSLKTTFPPARESDVGLGIRAVTNQSWYNHHELTGSGNDPILGPWTYCFNASVPVHLEVLYIRVIGLSPIDALDPNIVYTLTLGTASIPTKIYATASSCGDFMYLSQSSHPPEEGSSVWSIGDFNRHIEEWRCAPCPRGADCRGAKLWSELYALYGYTRLGVEDFSNRRDAFWPCFKQRACLGGKLTLATGEKPGTKHSYTSWDRPPIDCCSAVDPEMEDIQRCEEDPTTFPSLKEKKRGFPMRGYVGFDPLSRGCPVDLSQVDDQEACHHEAGFRLRCNYTKSGKCRLCRACKKGYWAQGVSNCRSCPHWLLNIILIVLAVSFVLSMLMMFLKTALEDTGAEAESTVIHFAQAQQKILLNHVQLIALASGFPLKWPEEVQSMFQAMSLFGAAGSYVFNPACSDDFELVEGESMFFQKQLGILVMPFFAAVLCALFWLFSAARDCCDNPDSRLQRYRARKKKHRLRTIRRNEKKRVGKMRSLQKKRKKIDDRMIKKRNRKIVPLAATASDETKTAETQAKAKSPSPGDPSLPPPLPPPITKDLLFIRSFFTLIDKNSDGKVTTSELLSAVVRRRAREPALDKAFVDLEMRFPKTKLLCRARTVKLALSQIDKEKDNVLTEQEMLQWCTRSSSSNIFSRLHGIAQWLRKSKQKKQARKKRRRRSTWDEAMRSTSFRELQNDAHRHEPAADAVNPKKKWGKMTNSEKADSVRKKWVHLRQGEADLAAVHSLNQGEGGPTFEIDGLNEKVQVIRFVLQPFVPLGVVWKPTESRINNQRSKSLKKKPIVQMGTIEDKYCAKINKIKGDQSQARLFELRVGDILRDFGGHRVAGMSFDEVKQLFSDAQFLAKPFTMTVVRKVHDFRDSVQEQVRQEMRQHQKEIGTWDKFVATLVTLLYLLYPTMIKSTYQLVSCQTIGSNQYLTMDLDIPCYKDVHMRWFLNVFLPALLGYVIGLPLLTLLVLIPHRKNLYKRSTRFRFGVLYSGYTEDCFFWETVIAGRKSAVVSVSVFMTTAGPESQALCGMMIVMCCTVLHLMFRPFQPVVEGKHETLFYTEFWGLQVAFVTFWTGLFFYQDIAQEKTIQMAFTIELLTINAVFLIAALRHYFILKLMDLSDQISTKQLQGYSQSELRIEVRQQTTLKRFFPQWQTVRNLWSRRAWQATAKQSILNRRTTGKMVKDNGGSQKAYTREHRHDDRYVLGNSARIHDHAISRLGLTRVRSKKKESEETLRSKAIRQRTQLKNNMEQISSGLHQEEKRKQKRKSQALAREHLLGLGHRQKAIENLQASVDGHDKVMQDLRLRLVDSKIRLMERLSSRAGRNLLSCNAEEEEAPRIEGRVASSASGEQKVISRMKEDVVMNVAPPKMNEQSSVETAATAQDPTIVKQVGSIRKVLKNVGRKKFDVMRRKLSQRRIKKLNYKVVGGIVKRATKGEPPSIEILNAIFAAAKVKQEKIMTWDELYEWLELDSGYNSSVVGVDIPGIVQIMKLPLILDADKAL